MQFDPPLMQGVLLRRYQRFLADVALADGRQITVHCPNTGSMKHCNAPGSAVLFSDSGNGARKYRHTLEAVATPSGAWAGINTARANALVEEGLQQALVPALDGYRAWRREVRYGMENSRIDFLLQQHASAPDCYVEVKNVTLEEDARQVCFPDAVTERGTRHLRELMAMRALGLRAVLFFCVQHSSAVIVSPARTIDPLYAATLEEAVAAGVEVVAMGAEISAQQIALRRVINFQLE